MVDEQTAGLDYSNGNSSPANAADAAQKSLSAVKERVSEQAADLKSKVSAQASQWGSQLGEKIDMARGRTSTQLRNTSQRIQHLADYVERNDAKDMSAALVNQSQQMIRKHPGKSLLAAVAIGFLIGRMCMKIK